MTGPGPTPPNGAAARLLQDTRVRFLVVGALAAATEFGVFVLLHAAGLPPVVANILSFIVGFVGSFIGYRLWSFAGEHHLSVRSQLASYGLLAAINVTATSTLVALFVGWGMYPWGAKLLCMAMVAAWNYLLLNRIVFQRHRPGSNTASV